MIASFGVDLVEIKLFRLERCFVLFVSVVLDVLVLVAGGIFVGGIIGGKQNDESRKGNWCVQIKIKKDYFIIAVAQ